MQTEHVGIRSSLVALLICGGLGLASFGCSTPALTQGGSTVMASRNAPSQEGFDPRACRNLGEVYGKGGGFGGAFVSNEELAKYAIIDARNQAAERGANFLQYDTPAFGQNGSDTDTTSATITGTAYFCPQPEQAAAPAPAPVAAAPAPAVPAQ